MKIKIWLTIIIINLILFSIGVYTIIQNSQTKAEQASMIKASKVVFDQNFSEKSLVIYDLVNSKSLSVDATFTDNSTEVALDPGAYKVVYENGSPSLIEQNIVVPNEPVVQIETQKNNVIAETSVTPTIAVSLPAGTFSNPLLNCPGYTFIRGFNPAHKGVDLSKENGCWISAAGDGTVTTVTWGSKGEGWEVIINHGNGFQTEYLNGNGQFKVKVGDKVKAGDLIMYMGNSGNSTQTQLHFSMKKNEQYVNPELYVKVR